MKRCLLALIFLYACTNEASVPDGVLPPQQMAAVLYDAIRADELTDLRVLQDSTFRTFGKRTALYDTVLRLHNLAKERFNASLAFYQGRPDLLKIVLDTLQQRVAADTPASKVKGPIRPQ